MGGTAQRAPVLFGKLFGMVCGMVAAATTRGFVTLGLAAPGAFMFTVGGQAGERGFGTLIRGPFAACGDSVGCEDVCVRPNEWAQQHDTLREHLRGHARSCEVIRGHQRSSEVIKGQQKSSEVIKGQQKSQRSSEVISIIPPNEQCRLHPSLSATSRLHARGHHAPRARWRAVPRSGGLAPHSHAHLVPPRVPPRAFARARGDRALAEAAQVLAAHQGQI